MLELFHLLILPSARHQLQSWEFLRQEGGSVRGTIDAALYPQKARRQRQVDAIISQHVLHKFILDTTCRPPRQLQLEQFKMLSQNQFKYHGYGIKSGQRMLKNQISWSEISCRGQALSLVDITRAHIYIYIYLYTYTYLHIIYLYTYLHIIYIYIHIYPKISPCF